MCVSIPITDDNIVEDPETFTVSLETDAPGVTLRPDMGEVLIIGDDREE